MTSERILQPMIPLPNQEQAISRMVSEPTRAALNGSLMGTGKTLMAVEVAKRINANTVLIVAPVNTHEGWKRTFHQQQVDLPFQRIDSTIAGKVAKEKWLSLEPGIYFVGTEMFVRLGWCDDLDKPFGPKYDRDGNVVVKDGQPVIEYDEKRSTVWNRKPDLVLFDEAHRGQNRNSKTYKTLKQLDGRYKLSMSGTPTGNRFDGAYAVTKWLWPDQVPGSFWNWVSMWCATEYDRFAPRNMKITGERIPGEYFKSLPCYIRLENDLGTPPKPEPRYVQISKEQRKAYDELEQEMVTFVENNPIIVDFPIVLQTRLRQATLGMFSVGEEGEVTFAPDCKSTKIDAMFDVLAKDFDGEPTLIFTDSQKFAAVATHRLNQKWPGCAREWSGAVSHAKREEIRKEFSSGKVKYIVAVISAMAEGVDGLQHTSRNVLWLSRSSNRILNEQGIFRIFRRGQEREVRNIEIVAVDTLDEGVLSKQLLDALQMNKILKVGEVA
jgi:superfamily II DNA or RNA helicase